eukprot:s447_g16.t1
MDVKSAFLQSDYIHQEMEIYGEPSADMRRLSAEMIGLREHQVMQMTKPAFGDVRAPRQWNDTADKALVGEVRLLKHELDGCIYISVRLATEKDHEFIVFEMDGQSWVVHGLFVIHVDDIMACGENVTGPDDARPPQGEYPSCFAERLHVLLHRFRFGSIEYHDRQVFCGDNMTQSFGATSVSFDLEKYIHQLKPLTVEKFRKTQPAQSATSSACISDLLEVSKTLRFAKEAASTALVLPSHGDLHHSSQRLASTVTPRGQRDQMGLHRVAG